MSDNQITLDDVSTHPVGNEHTRTCTRCKGVGTITTSLDVVLYPTDMWQAEDVASNIAGRHILGR